MMEKKVSKREHLKNKKRVVIKIGSSSLVHHETGRLNFPKMEILVREVADLHNKGVSVVLVSSGAIAVGKAAMGITEVTSVQAKQACAAIGQVRLLSIYQKFFSEYGLNSAQILMTKDTFTDTESRRHARNTFEQLLAMGVIPIVNENDTISTAEIEFGDNDRLSAVVAALIGADLLLLMSDIDGLYTDDPRTCKDAKFIPVVEKLDETFMNMGKGSTGSRFGSGGMNTKLIAADIATSAGCDMIIANASDFHIIHKLVEGREFGTIFLANPKAEFYLLDYLENYR